jgi:hypothetical protein
MSMGISWISILAIVVVVAGLAAVFIFWRPDK